MQGSEDVQIEPLSGREKRLGGRSQGCASFTTLTTVTKTCSRGRRRPTPLVPHFPLDPPASIASSHRLSHRPSRQKNTPHSPQLPSLERQGQPSCQSCLHRLLPPSPPLLPEPRPRHPKRKPSQLTPQHGSACARRILLSKKGWGSEENTQGREGKGYIEPVNFFLTESNR
jgi:hypothetical protein